MNQEYLKQQLILSLANDGIYTIKHLVRLQREKCRIHGGDFFRTIDLLKTYHKLVKSKKVIVESGIEKLLTMKKIRSLSGIVVVSVLTKPYPCPGKCIYCPTELNVPKSYLSNEPAVMRAIALNYDPYIQTAMRLKALKEEGHPTDKINIRIIGGTWSYYPKKYRDWFIIRIFEACNQYKKFIKLESYKVRKVDNNKQMNLFELQKQNESAKHRIVEISIETRQDFINEKEIKHLRNLGVTKVEMGVQSIYDDILRLNNRGHNIKETIHATKLLKNAGFKVSYQMMLNLYGSDINRDKKMFEELFQNPDFKPDHLKIYPLALVKNSKLYKFYQINKFKPYTKEQLIKLLTNIKKQIPYYCRIERIIRDIPAKSIVEGGTKFSNMRQILQKEKVFCKCIRCREVKDRNEFIKLKVHKVYQVEEKLASLEGNNGSSLDILGTGKRTLAPLRNSSGSFSNKREDVYLFKEVYSASGGKEIFLSIENGDRTKLFSLLRLRIPSQILENKKHFLPILQGSAIIREIHTYGQQIKIDKTGNAAQHKGLGKFLIEEAENITKHFGLKKITVIAGVGVRGYFRKLEYNLENNYMVKNI